VRGPDTVGGREVPDRVVVGQVVKLQVQRNRLRTGDKYSLDHLSEVSALRLTPDGAIGFDGASWVIDCHHRAHPSAVPYKPERVLSIGFSSHYEYMWRMFEPIPFGAAGENLIVQTDRLIRLEDVKRGIRIESSTDTALIRTVAVAEPCVAFTRLVTGRPDARAADILEERNCLREGVRGFVMALDGIDNFDVSPGDRVSIPTG